VYPLQVSWFDTRDALTQAVEGSLAVMRLIDMDIARSSSVQGFCVQCARVCTMTVNGGAVFGTDVNLREGLVCQSCGLSSRSRLLFHAARSLFAPNKRLALLEAFSPLASYVSAAWPGVRLSEFHSPSALGGRAYDFFDESGRCRRVVHEDMQALSFESESLDGILHNDVLEHVPDPQKGLRECLRVLVPGGIALFTMPWFPWLPSTLVRGMLDGEGSLVEYLPTELHGDGLRPEGIYTFHNFGANFADLLSQAGFSRVSFGVCYDPYAGFVTNNYRYGDEFLMLPTLMRAVR